MDELAYNSYRLVHDLSDYILMLNVYCMLLCRSKFVKPSVSDLWRSLISILFQNSNVKVTENCMHIYIFLYTVKVGSRIGSNKLLEGMFVLFLCFNLISSAI